MCCNFVSICTEILTSRHPYMAFWHAIQCKGLIHVFRSITLVIMGPELPNLVEVKLGANKRSPYYRGHTPLMLIGQQFLLNIFGSKGPRATKLGEREIRDRNLTASVLIGQQYLLSIFGCKCLRDAEHSMLPSLC